MCFLIILFAVWRWCNPYPETEDAEADAIPGDMTSSSRENRRRKKRKWGNMLEKQPLLWYNLHNDRICGGIVL